MTNAQPAIKTRLAPSGIFQLLFLGLTISLSLGWLSADSVSAKLPIAAVKPPASAQSPAKTLAFPSDKNYGTIMLFSRESDIFACSNNKSGVRAQGTINVQKNTWVWYDAGPLFLQHPESLKALPKDAFDILQIHFVAMDPAEDHLIDDALTYSNRFTTVKRLILNRSDVCDSQLIKFSRLKDLENIEVLGTKCNGSFLKTISGSKTIKRLLLMHLLLDKSNLRYLSSLPALDHLDIAYSKLNADDIKIMAPLQNLVEMDLSHNKEIDDRAMDTVKTFKKLYELDLRSTGVTIKGLEKLKGLKLTHLFVPQSSVGDRAQDLKTWFPLAKINIEKPRKSKARNEYQEIQPLKE